MWWTRCYLLDVPRRCAFIVVDGSRGWRHFHWFDRCYCRGVRSGLQRSRFLSWYWNSCARSCVSSTRLWVVGESFIRGMLDNSLCGRFSDVFSRWGWRNNEHCARLLDRFSCGWGRWDTRRPLFRTACGFPRCDLFGVPCRWANLVDCGSYWCHHCWFIHCCCRGHTSRGLTSFRCPMGLWGPRSLRGSRCLCALRSLSGLRRLSRLGSLRFRSLSCFHICRLLSWHGRSRACSSVSCLWSIVIRGMFGLFSRYLVSNYRCWISREGWLISSLKHCRRSLFGVLVCTSSRLHSRWSWRRSSSSEGLSGELDQKRWSSVDGVEGDIHWLQW